jgi:hypothetical protein
MAETICHHDSEGYRYEEWTFPLPLFVNDSAICVISRPSNTVAMCTASILQWATAVCAADCLQRC